MSNLITTLSTWGTTASCIQSLCCCFRDENNHLSTWNMSSPKNIQGTTSKVKWCPWMPVGVTDTPREEKWKTNRRKKERRWKVVVEKREETREESKRCIWRPAVAQGHHHHRLNASLCEILRIVEVVTVKGPHNLCRIFNHVTSRFERYQWLPTSYKVKDKMFDNHST